MTEQFLNEETLKVNPELNNLELPKLEELNKNNKIMPIAEFRSYGYLQELNRLFLHPLGLTLTIKIDDEGNQSLSHIGDFREEGIRFDESLMNTKEFKERVINVAREFEIRKDRAEHE